MQVIVNIIYSFSVILLFSFSVGISYRTSKFINIATAGYITLGAYFYHFFLSELSLPIYISVFLAVVVNILICGIINFAIMHLSERNKLPTYSLLVLSIGIYIVIQNLISLIWHDDIKSINSLSISVGHQILNGHITTIQIYSVVISTLLIVSLITVLKYTGIGRLINAISSDSKLSLIFGINSQKVISITSVFSIFLATVGGILVGLDTGLTPNMGFSFLIFALVAVIIGGVSSNLGIVIGALFLTIAQNLASYYMSPAFIDITAYIVLIVFLVLKPRGIAPSVSKKIII